MKKIVLIVLTSMFMVGCVQEPAWPSAFPLGKNIPIDNKPKSDKMLM